jgi:hypothetical protein
MWSRQPCDGRRGRLNILVGSVNLDTMVVFRSQLLPVMRCRLKSRARLEAENIALRQQLIDGPTLSSLSVEFRSTSSLVPHFHPTRCYSQGDCVVATTWSIENGLSIRFFRIPNAQIGGD